MNPVKVRWADSYAGQVETAKRRIQMAQYIGWVALEQSWQVTLDTIEKTKKENNESYPMRLRQHAVF